jgi:hypothetical protein
MTQQVVVDTDVVSFIFKNHAIGLRYDPELAGRVALISFMTVAELERWAVQRRGANGCTGCACICSDSQ